MRVIATGLTGTIGKHLQSRVEHLSIRLDRDIDIDPESMHGSSLIHLAAVVGEARVRDDLDTARAVNVESVVQLGQLVRKSHDARFLFVSTSHVYELPRDNRLLSETAPTLPRGHYPLQKLIAEQLLLDLFRDKPDKLVIARVFSVIDAEQPPGTLGHSIIRLIDDEDHQLLYTDDERDFLSPRIIADILLQIAERDDVNGIINVCSGKSLSVHDTAALLLPTEVMAKVGSRLVGGRSSVPRIVGNGKRLESVLGLAPGELFDRFTREMLTSR